MDPKEEEIIQPQPEAEQPKADEADDKGADEADAELEAFDPLEVAGDDKEDDTEDDAEDDLAPEDKARIARAVSKETQPIKQQLFSERRDAEVSKFMSTSEGSLFGKYEEKIRRYSKMPAFKTMKIEALAATVVGAKGLMRLGAAHSQKIESENRKKNIASNAIKAESGAEAVDYDKLSNDEVIKRADALIRQKL